MTVECGVGLGRSMAGFVLFPASAGAGIVAANTSLFSRKIGWIGSRSKIYNSNRRNAKTEGGVSANIADSKIAHADYVHADQNIAADIANAGGDLNFRNHYAVREPNGNQVGATHGASGDAVNGNFVDFAQPEFFGEGFSDGGSCGASVPDSEKLLRVRNKWPFVGTRETNFTRRANCPCTVPVINKQGVAFYRRIHAVDALCKITRGVWKRLVYSSSPGVHFMIMNLPGARLLRCMSSRASVLVGYSPNTSPSLRAIILPLCFATRAYWRSIYMSSCDLIFSMR